MSLKQRRFVSLNCSGSQGFQSLRGAAANESHLVSSNHSPRNLVTSTSDKHGKKGVAVGLRVARIAQRPGARNHCSCIHGMNAVSARSTWCTAKRTTSPPPTGPRPGNSGKPCNPGLGLIPTKAFTGNSAQWSCKSIACCGVPNDRWCRPSLSTTEKKKCHHRADRRYRCSLIMAPATLSVGCARLLHGTVRSVARLEKGATRVQDVRPGNTVEILEHLHRSLDAHFRQLHAVRCEIGDNTTPVFALEHDLDEADFELLLSSVRAAVAQGFGPRFRVFWLPFVVYAAESGYGYVGDEYWQSFEASTPSWHAFGDRDRIRRWFVKFADQYGGAVPRGAFAAHFQIIAWPITHAVLPRDLQRHLAQLLFEFSNALTSDLLHNPAELGIRLASRVGSFTERFRVFCENTPLLGQVSAALLSGDDEPTPYLLASTLDRIVDGLSKEHQAHHWLKSARTSASRVRGFQSLGGTNAVATTPRAQSRVTDPRLFLRFDASWTAYAELPDLTPLATRLPDIYNQLRMSRTTVNGASRPVPPSGLLYGGQEVRFANWPRPDQPFLQLERGDEETNYLLADQSVITHGPWWLFRRQGTALAIEIKGKFVRPGQRYVLIGADAATPPAVQWCTEAAVDVQGVRAYELAVPDQIREDEEAALRASGIGSASHVAIRPIGVVPSAWDGQGEAEWPAGEPALLGVRSDLLPQRCRVVLDGATYFLEWPRGESELLFALDRLNIGTHELSATLLGEGDRQLAAGSFVITIRDPQIRPEGATIGEGIRMLPTPARPTLSELWDERAVVTIDGPLGASAELLVSLQDGSGKKMAQLRRSLRLPVDEGSWKATVRSIRADHRFNDAYDGAESCVITVSRHGIGFASLRCERGFRPLRWRFMRSNDGQIVAVLVDRTDGATTTVEFFDVEAPMTAVPKTASEPFRIPVRGGLAVARAGDVTAAVILPTDPNAVLRMPPAQPLISCSTRSPKKVLLLAHAHQQWLNADLPADAFAMYEQRIVGDAIAQAIGILIGGSHWAQIEQRLATVSEAADLLEAMQNAVGVTPSHRAIASTIAHSFYKWLTPESLLVGFSEVITPHLIASGVRGKPSAPRFLLTLAGRPGRITEWDPSEAESLIDRVLLSPILYRAARFAVLGTRALNDADGLERGF